MTLEEAALGQRVQVCDLLIQDSMRRRLLDLGILYDTWIEPVYDSPSGHMRAYFVNGAVSALRDSESKRIQVRERG